MAAYTARWMTYIHLQADCLYTGISSGLTLDNEYGMSFTFTVGECSCPARGATNAFATARGDKTAMRPLAKLLSTLVS